MSSQHDWSPIAIFQGAASHLYGRMIVFLVVVLLGSGVGATMAWMFGRPVAPGVGVIFYPFFVIIGITQVWGILSYLVIFTTGIVYVTHDISGRWMWFVFGLQAAETFRCCFWWAADKT